MTSNVKPVKIPKYSVLVFSQTRKRYRILKCFTMSDVARVTIGLKTNWEVRVKNWIVLTDNHFGDDCINKDYLEKYNHAIRAMKSKGYIK